jgi:hypothetical protein
MSKILNIFESYAAANKLIMLNDFNRCLRNNGIRHKMTVEGFEDLIHSSRKFMFEALQSKNGLVYLREEYDDDSDDFEDDYDFGGGGIRGPHELYSTDRLEDDYDDDDRYGSMRSQSRQYGPGHYGDHGYAYYVCPSCGESGSDEECQYCMDRLTSSDYVENIPSSGPSQSDQYENLDYDTDMDNSYDPDFDFLSAQEDDAYYDFDSDL